MQIQSPRHSQSSPMLQPPALSKTPPPTFKGLFADTFSATSKQVNSEHQKAFWLACRIGTEADLREALKDKKVDVQQKYSKQLEKEVPSNISFPAPTPDTIRRSVLQGALKAHTPLHFLCANPNLTKPMLKLLLNKKGVDINAKDLEKKTPLDYLQAKLDSLQTTEDDTRTLVEMVTLMKKKGAIPGDRGRKSAPTSRECSGLALAPSAFPANNLLVLGQSSPGNLSPELSRRSSRSSSTGTLAPLLGST